MSLDQQTAIRRAGLIRKGSIQYNFHIILEATRYHGLAELTFYLETSKLQQDLEIDFSGRTVETLIVNNLEVEINHSQNFIFVPRNYLQKGRNRVSVLYQCVYDIDQSGCISFDDEGEQLVYTDFQPYSANRVFPCFDQPDLKATFKLTVVTPPLWRALSNENPATVGAFREETFLKQASWGHERSRFLLNRFASKVGADTKITTFGESKLLPSYIFCFAAGKYEQIPSKGPFPMSLFCPPTSLDNLAFYSEFIFDVTSKCMTFYETTFGVKYPFVKYDQIFIRQCGFLAMENAGLVTFNEPRLLRNRNPTESDYYRFALVIAHELSHHWFGNYVTMTWWDDVWLNQSFAEWISCYCLQKLKGTFLKPFQSSYFYFRDNKVYGYEEDERNGATHPIRGVVKDTLEAESVFDGITYEKGASVLKQIMHLVTEEKFSTCLATYFSKFPWGNATIDNLLFYLAPAFPSTVNVDSWKQSWLEQSSLNVFTIDWDRANSIVNVNQTSFNNNNILRVHQISMGLFKSDGTYDVYPSILIDTAQKPKVIDYSAYVGPYSAVLLNHGDETFVENIIDPVSLQFFKNNIDKIGDIFVRINIWYNIRSMVNLSMIPVADYVALIENKLFIDQSYVILDKILNNLSVYLDNYVREDIGNTLRSRILLVIYRQLINVADTQTSRILILSNCYISYARSELQIINLQKWLFSTDPNLTKRALSLDQKWAILKKVFTLTSITPQQKLANLQTIKKQDTDKARISDGVTVCNIIIADAAQFSAIYEEFKSTSVSLTEKKLKLAGWRNRFHYEQIIKTYQEKYYLDIITVSQILSYDQFEFFYDRLQPVDTDSAYHITKYNQVIADLQKLDGMEQHCRNLRKIIDDLSLRVKNVAYNIDINNALSQVRANLRFSYITPGSISYIYHIGFVKVENYYTGMAEITFTLSQVPIFLPLDCICETIYSLKVNGKKIYPNTNAEFLLIYQDYLVKGANFISIHYRNQYNNDGLGCMSYIQTVSIDNPQYIYTKFQPYGAHRFAPCFDQPDLKAKVIFNVIVPTGWMAAANQDYYYTGVYSPASYQQYAVTNDQALLSSYLQNKQGTFYTFFPTQILSTYLYCVVAGQYYSVTPTPAQIYRGIPMTLYSLQSYKPSLDRLAPFIFQMTTLSLQLYESKFGVNYPFSKYDSVFCHEFKSGAMQNAGIITFNDTYLYPQEVSLEKMLAFASTIVHENSHNWFGNYVTMKWWDDLWLNQSFADFIAHWCLQQIKGKVKTIPTYDSGWKIFLVRGVAGYREDQITETTHAVRSIVENTSIAQTYFDRITYQKGSATLKQFMFLMGEDNFFRGVQDYFQEFGWSNGTIDDFLGKMQKYFTITDFTLDAWKNSWLLTPSLNVVSVDWDPSDISPTAQLTINQVAYTSQYPTLRYHKTRVALFKADNTYDTFDVLLTPSGTTILEYDGSQNYLAVLVNVDYWGYFKYQIDPTSLEYFKNNLNSIPNVLTRMIIWHDINEQVRDSGFKVVAYKDLFLKYIFDEKDDKIFQFEFSFIRDALNNYIKIGARPALKSEVFQAVYNQLKNALVKDDTLNRSKLLKDQLTVFAANPEQVALLYSWRAGSFDIPDLASYPITVSQGWEVVKLVYSQDQTIYSTQVKGQIYSDQLTKDRSIKAQLVKNTCDMIIADAALLSTTYDSFKQMALSLDAKASYAQGWNNLRHLTELSTIYKPKYFTDLPILSKTLISNHFQFFYQNLKPVDDNLQQTIDSYLSINLQGSNMIGHIKVLKQIRYNYELRLGLYGYNA